MELKIAHCCGSCKYSNKPEKTEDNEYYSVAKTERWCFRNNINVIRESVCDNFELEDKKGANPSFKRILAFNRRVEEINKIKNWILENNIPDLAYYDYPNHKCVIFKVIDDKLQYKSFFSDYFSVVPSKDKTYIDMFYKAQKEYLKKNSL